MSTAKNPIGIDGRIWVADEIAAGRIDTGVTPEDVFRSAWNTRQGKRYNTFPQSSRGVMDCHTGNVIPMPAAARPTARNARDWAAELNG